MSVSYTHLDVYKRQVLAGPYFAFRMGGKLKPNDNVEALIKGAMEENNLPGAIKYDDIKDVCSDLMGDNLKTVSYTHLDVYKRQVSIPLNKRKACCKQG